MKAFVEMCAPSFDRLAPESSTPMSHSNCVACVACGLPVINFSTDEVEENSEMHAGCVTEFELADEGEDGDASFDFGYEDSSLDGDAESALASCGWGTDEDYGDFGGNDGGFDE